MRGLRNYLLLLVMAVAVVACSGTSKNQLTLRGDLVDVRLFPVGDTLSYSLRPIDAEQFGERQEARPQTQPWEVRSAGLADVTAYIVILGPTAKIMNLDDLTASTVGVEECGHYECAVFEVPRRSKGEPQVVNISAGKSSSDVVLESRPVGEGGLHGEFTG